MSHKTVSGWVQILERLFPLFRLSGSSSSRTAGKKDYVSSEGIRVCPASLYLAGLV